MGENVVKEVAVDMDMSAWRFIIPHPGGHVSVEFTQPIHGNYIGFDAKGTPFLFREGRMVCGMTPEQVMWLEGDLASDPARWCLELERLCEEDAVDSDD